MTSLRHNGENFAASMHQSYASGVARMHGVVRQRRLDRCRSDLEAARRTESITSIALRWGFNDPSHFSRLFRRRYRIAPRALARKRQEA